METESVDLTHGDIPPFVLHWFYLAGVRFIITSQLRGLGVIETALEKLNAKWKSAGMFLLVGTSFAFDIQLTSLQGYIWNF